MIYDARTGAGLRSGDVSRYVLQLRHLYAKDRIKESDWKFELSGKENHDPSIDKNEEIRERLRSYIAPDGKRNFSASTLNTYRECQVRFFYEKLMGIKFDPEPTEFVDAITIGDIVHGIMSKIYLSGEQVGKYLASPEIVDAEKIKTILADGERLRRMVTMAVNKEHFHLKDDELLTPLSGSSEMVAFQIERQIRNVLRHDLKLAPFALYGCEIEREFPVTLKNGRKLNFKFIIDRLDEINRNGNKQLRIIDYKTGSIDLEAVDMTEMFAGGYMSKYSFQLMIYAWLLKKSGLIHGVDDVRLEIYDVNAIQNGEERLPIFASGPVRAYSEVSEEFNSRIEEMLNGIFDNSRFEAIADDASCGYCRLKTLCRR